MKLYWREYGTAEYKYNVCTVAFVLYYLIYIIIYIYVYQRIVHALQKGSCYNEKYWVDFLVEVLFELYYIYI